MTDERAGIVLTRMLHALDALDWNVARRCLAEEITTDYTELFGGEIETMPADDLITQWQALLPGFDATQHVTGPFLAERDSEGGTRRIEAHVRAFHHLADHPDGEVWGVHGNYVVHVVPSEHAWLIARLALELFYQEGNLQLSEIATKRAREQPRAPRPRTP